jgi:hypothetical protein
MALDPNIAMGYRGVEIANPLVQYGQVAQIQAAQNQNQVSQMQLDQMRRDEETMRQIQAKAVAHGGPSDLNLIADAYINSGNHKFIEFGVGLRQKLDEKAQFAKIMGLGGPTGAPEPTAAPAAAPTAPATPTVAYPQTAAPTNALGSGTFGMSPAAAPVNALAPAVAPTAPAAPVNALTAPPVGPDITLLRRKRDMFLAMGTAQGNAAAKTMDAEIALASRAPTMHSVAPGNVVLDANGKPIFTAPERADTDLIRNFNAAKAQGFTGSIFDYEKKINESRRQPRAESAPRTQQVTLSDGTLGVVNMDTGVITRSTVDGASVKGKPSAFAEKAAAQKAQMGKDLGFAIAQLADITKDGGLIDQSTGSGAGKLIDLGAGFVGKATPGAIAIGKIAPVADLALKMIPRFEGPQSNADTKSYKEAAGQLADSSLPTEIRKQAGRVVLRLMKERQGQFVTSDMAAEGATAASTGVDASNPLLNPK